LNSVETLIYKTVGGHALHADVYRHPSGERRPGVLWLHGGAMMTADRTRLRPEQRDRYLAAGYTLVSADYRLAPETHLDELAEDVLDAYRWMVAEASGLGIDPARTAIVGPSAGGYLTLLCGARLKPGPQALVAYSGYGELTTAWANQPDPYYCSRPPISREEAYALVGHGVLSTNPGQERKRFYHYTRQQGRWATEVVGHDPSRDPGDRQRYDPRANVSPDYPPTLLLHGDDDEDVPYEQAVLMAQELARHGVEYQLFTLPNTRHGFEKPEIADGNPVVAQAIETAMRFLERKLEPG
jgi:acetyl esterase/lipase